MTLHDLVVKLRERLKQADEALEPHSWDINLGKAELRALLDAVELDPEHRHLIVVTNALG